jgi:hypothetical protein
MGHFWVQLQVIASFLSIFVALIFMAMAWSLWYLLHCLLKHLYNNCIFNALQCISCILVQFSVMTYSGCQGFTDFENFSIHHKLYVFQKDDLKKTQY